MSNIDLQDARAWAEPTKLDLGSLEDELEASVSAQVLGRVAQAYTTSSWTTPSTTPRLIRTVIGMLYVSYIHTRTYAEDTLTNVQTYGELLYERAQLLLDQIVAGDVTLVEVTTEDVGGPAFYPTDASTASDPDPDDTSLGPEKFTMGVVW